jgi:hypothetical protein
MSHHQSSGKEVRVLARIIFKRTKKHVATTMTRRLWEIFLVKCQKQAFSFNKREAKVYCCFFIFSFMRAGGARVPAWHAKCPG